MLRFLVLCCAMLSLGGCWSFTQYNGYPATGVQFWNEVKVGTKKSEVVKLLGSPVIVDDKGTWLYPSCEVRGVVASVIRKYSCAVLKVSFEEGGNKVSGVERIATPMRHLPRIESTSTPITGVNDGAWRKIGNMLNKLSLRSKTE
ncbi:outer membrane protein assembly factor BamE [Anaplasma capra]|uniref:outer membrane protein assembly factor BamE n=1 Tax=Anaplasma capra TaxID=1562740 RepID=UPI0021D5B8D1|nr:outer membrane protein assembly factor BamE [Anaplasma capra]MCU7611614.1 outer membrane protein assembly factor BamE [Anaplasma capra]